MEVVYRANDGIEAQLLVDLLEGEGIPAEIHGAFLQGATGELPPTGLVSILTSAQHHARARELIAGREARRSRESAIPEPRRVRKPSWAGLAFVSGLAIGIAGAGYYFHAPTSSNGVDYNLDGVVDERMTYAPSGDPVTFEADRNLDGKIDLRLRYDRRGWIKDGQSDDDFDGTMETASTYFRGNVQVVESDTDGDGKPDIRWRNRHGVADTMDTLDPVTGRVVRIEHYQLGALVSAEIDADHDGILDTRTIYNALGDPLRSEALNPSTSGR